MVINCNYCAKSAEYGASFKQVHFAWVCPGCMNSMQQSYMETMKFKKLGPYALSAQE